MAAEYPSAIKSWTPVVDDVNDVMADDVNSIYEEIEAVQTELGEDVAGDAADLVTRLAVSLSTAATSNCEAPSTLTISQRQSHHSEAITISSTRRARRQRTTSTRSAAEIGGLAADPAHRQQRAGRGYQAQHG
jgi:hypothetical protein